MHIHRNCFGVFEVDTGCERVNSRDIREWISDGEEQLMVDNRIVDIPSHYW